MHEWCQPIATRAVWKGLHLGHHILDHIFDGCASGIEGVLVHNVKRCDAIQWRQTTLTSAKFSWSNHVRFSCCVHDSNWAMGMGI